MRGQHRSANIRHDEAYWVAGVGCRRGCHIDELTQLVLACCRDAGIEPAALAVLATIAPRRDDPTLQRVAARLGIDLVAWPGPVLARFEPLLSHRSARVATRYGVAGIAEAAALAQAAGGDPTDARVRLVVPRRTSAAATAAIACRGDHSVE